MKRKILQRGGRARDFLLEIEQTTSRRGLSWKRPGNLRRSLYVNQHQPIVRRTASSQVNARLSRAMRVDGTTTPGMHTHVERGVFEQLCNKAALSCHCCGANVSLEPSLEVEQASVGHAERLHSRPMEGQGTTKGLLLRGADRPS